MGDEASEWLGFLWPWLLILAMGAPSSPISISGRVSGLATAGALSALIMLGHDLATIGLVLRPGSY
jgi:hypothetical protein